MELYVIYSKNSGNFIGCDHKYSGGYPVEYTVPSSDGSQFFFHTKESAQAYFGVDLLKYLRKESQDAKVYRIGFNFEEVE